MTKTMTKSALIKAVAEEAGLTAREITSALEALSTVTTREAIGGTPVAIPGIVKLRVKDRPARTVHNPSTGEPIEKPADRTVVASVAKALKQAAA